MTLNQMEIEFFAVQIAEPGCDLSCIKTMIEYLPGSDLKAVIDRAADRHAVESAPIPSSVAKAKIREQISRLAVVGQPSVGRMVALGDTEAEFPTATLQKQVRLTQEIWLAFVEVTDPVALSAWLLPERLISALDREVEQIADDKNSLDDATRATKLATIAADMLATEREEETLIALASTSGTEVMRRPDADPRRPRR